MKKTINYSVIGILFIFMIGAVLIFRPVPIVAESEAFTEKGIVSEIYSTEGNDVFIILENKPRRFYINRGLELGLEVDHLKEKLIGKFVVLKYPKYWTPLDWNNRIKHLSKLQYNDQVLFNELK